VKVKKGFVWENLCCDSELKSVNLFYSDFTVADVSSAIPSISLRNTYPFAMSVDLTVQSRKWTIYPKELPRCLERIS